MGESFSRMAILSLHANKFYGHIPKELCHLTSLQILDLAHNNLSGTIPSCFSNFNSMAPRQDSVGKIYFYKLFCDSALVVMKGKVVEYSTILGYVRSMDLSSNDLSGEIPKELTSLNELQSLSLSDNFLLGKIPQDIGAMGSLGSLDFSHNQLLGEIPQSLARLKFLSHLNFSYNNLSGRIPPGTQLQGFSSSNFIGNKELCGLPLTENCSGDGGIPTVGNGGKKGDNGFDVDWLYVSMPVGFVVGFWVVMGPLIFNRR